MRAELRSLCDWYNSARTRPSTTPYRLAAELQQRFISIHPFDHDYNGRSSRLLMNWALEREGLPPSAVADFDKDLFSTTEEWTEAVRAGSDAFAARAARLERLGDDADPITVFDLEHERERYLACHQTLRENPAQSLHIPGHKHDIHAHRALLEQLRGNRKAEAGSLGSQPDPG